MRMRTVLLFLAPILAALAEDPPPAPKRLAEIPTGWERFSPGTWVETRITSADAKDPPITTRTTLKPARDGRAWISTLRTSDPKAVESESSVDATWLGDAGIEPAGEDDVKVGEATYHCKVWKGKNGAKDGSSGWKVWLCADSKELGGLVRMETWEDKGSWTSSSVTKLIDTGREVEVCGRKVRCHVIQMAETKDGEKWLTTLEEVQSWEVPGGTVKRTMWHKGYFGGEAHEGKSTEEVFAIHLEGGEWAPAEKK